MTTDHISPAGSIKPDSPAGEYLIERGVSVADFNSYGSRRGNDRVMTRGTFANIRVRNELAPGTEGGWTTDLLDGEVKSVYEAAMHYQEAGVPLVVLAGKDYGMGSSRDWAAKGTFLLGVSAPSSQRASSGSTAPTWWGWASSRSPMRRARVPKRSGSTGPRHSTSKLTTRWFLASRSQVRATRPDGDVIEFVATCRVDTPVEVEYYRNGGILHTVLRRMAAR